MWSVVVFIGLLGCRKPAQDHHAPAEAGSGAPSRDAASTAVAHQGEACPQGTTCDSGLTCVAYRGVGGNELHSCEIPCADNATACPAGQTCATVKDGPGQVCMSTGAPTPKDAGPTTGHQRMACVNGACDPGLACVKYRGVGGNELSSCELPCDADHKCPSGQGCTMIADGPGQVCVANSAPAPRDAGTIDAAPPRGAHQGEKCGGTIACDGGLTCVAYRGVTGAELHSCEIPCGGGVTCPTGQECTTTRDGPGRVCIATDAPIPSQGQKCPAGGCASGLECIEYFGIAGPRGPKFTSCEIRCSADKPCAKPQKCVTIADGPGQVCRP